ncbi:hypothetical protein BD626DRAFT_103502 [Schizophyllum amplum]|uniref:Small ribosomal subunit protein bS18m n=1 Tax=Schizophyllum amplum TaxID=97359 RepID=A0A550CS48_9AGAR|nr:hypothetical protein BD626DRAFT_103502 [Auriculariopsis ampla]
MLAALRATVPRCPRHAAGIASTARRANDKAAVDARLDKLQAVAREEGKKQQEQKMSRAVAATTGAYAFSWQTHPPLISLKGVAAGRRPTNWNTFLGQKFIRPRDFTYKERTKATRFKRARPPSMPPPTYQARAQDLFHKLNIDPLQFSTHPLILRDFVSEMGMIQGRNQTCLTSKSHRRLTRAIKRAKMMGVIPQLSRPSEGYQKERKVGTAAFVDLMGSANQYSK